MDFVDTSGTRYQLTETVESPAPAKKPVVWPWVIGGLALAGGLVWMASSTSRKANPVTPGIEALITEARDPNTERWRLWALFNDHEVEVRRALLDNPNVCPTDEKGQRYTSLLAALAEKFPEEMAEHPLFVLHALIEPTDEMSVVVTQIVRQTEDVGLIERLWTTWGPSSEWVRQALARNHKTPEGILRLLGNDQTEPDPAVRKTVAGNQSAPVDALRVLGNETTESDGRVRAVVAKNPNTPADVLRLLGNQATESEAYVRQAVAENPNTPEDVLRLLGNQATERNWMVRVYVTNNPNTSENILHTLAEPTKEPDGFVLASAKNAITKRSHGTF